MLINFTVGNFLSFKDKKTLSMEATAITEFKDRVIVKGKHKLLPSAVIYGANSSGKSNLIKAMEKFVDLVIDSTKLNSKDTLDITPFLLNPNTEKQPSYFEIELFVENDVYRYGFSADNKKVYEEWLYQKKDDMCYPVKKDSPVGREDNLFNILSVNQLSVDEYRRINGNNPSIVFNQSFQTAAYAFRAIDTSTIGVIVPYKSEGKEIIISICSSDEIEKEYKLLKKAQRYSINLYKSEFNEMVNKQAVHEVQKNSGIYYLDSVWDL